MTKDTPTKESLKITLIHMIAEGGYGRVYLTDDEKYENSVFKVFYEKDITPPCLELDCMFRMNHPNIMKAEKIYTTNRIPSKMEDVDENDETIPETLELFENGSGKYLVIQMERAQCDIQDWREEELVQYEDKIDAFWQILCAVEFLHRCQLLHLDIKTENILVMKDERVVLTDFGLVVPTSTHGRQRHYDREMITSNYRPPENLDRKNPRRGVYGQTSDVWSLGILFCEIFISSGKYFITESQVNRIKFHLKPSNLRNFISSKIGRCLTNEQKEEWYPILEKMLDFDPSKRPTVKEVMMDDIFIKYGYKYKEVADLGELIQPIFPPQGSDILQDDYRRKLEYALHHFFHIFSYFVNELKENFPVQVIFIAVDIFLRYRHLFDNNLDIIALSIFCSTQICCECEVSFEQLEDMLKCKDVEKKWIDFLFSTKCGEYQCIFAPDTPFVEAKCQCRLNTLIRMLCQNPIEYVKLYYTPDYFPICEQAICYVEPDWYLKDWFGRIQEMNPSFRLVMPPKQSIKTSGKFLNKKKK